MPACAGATGPPPRVFVATRHSLLGHTLGDALSEGERVEVIVLDAGADDIDLVAECRTGDAGVVLIDLDDESLETPWLAELLAADLPAHLMVLAETADLETVTEAVERGVRGFVTVDTPITKISDAIRDVCAGRTVLPPLSPDPDTRPVTDARLEALTQRERDILRRLARGESTEQIARENSITVNTARTHIQNILSKLGLHSRVQAAAYAARAGLE